MAVAVPMLPLAALPLISGDELKHWSKAMSSVLRYEVVRGSPASFENVIARVHHSTRFGNLTVAKIEYVLLMDSRHRRRFTRVEYVDVENDDSIVLAVRAN